MPCPGWEWHPVSRMPPRQHAANTETTGGARVPARSGERPFSLISGHPVAPACPPAAGHPRYGRAEGSSERMPVVSTAASRTTVGPPSHPDPPLAGRVVVVTGVSRRAGIGHAIACRAAAWGASLLCHHYSPHDALQPWGADNVAKTMASIRSHLKGGADLVDLHADLRQVDAPARVIDRAVEAFGHVDALVCNQASSGSDGPLEDLSAADLDHHWAVDARASLLLAQAYAARRRPVIGRRPWRAARREHADRQDAPRAGRRSRDRRHSAAPGPPALRGVTP